MIIIKLSTHVIMYLNNKTLLNIFEHLVTIIHNNSYT